MHDQEELERLEALYRQIIPEEKILTSEQEDQKILNLAKNHLDRNDKLKVVSIERYKKARAIWAGLSIAAVFLIGILLNPISESYRNPISESPKALPLADGQVIDIDDGSEHQQIASDDLEAPEDEKLVAESVLDSTPNSESPEALPPVDEQVIDMGDRSERQQIASDDLDASDVQTLVVESVLDSRPNRESPKALSPVDEQVIDMGDGSEHQQIASDKLDASEVQTLLAESVLDSKPNRESPKALLPIDGQMIYMGDGSERQQIALDDLDAPELQTLIAELVLRGELDNAESLLAYFRSRHPEFSAKMIDMDDGAERKQIATDDLDAPELQNLIAELVMRGEFDNAKALLAHFRSRYPEFRAEKR
jgi:hypothetical protein